LEENDIFNHLYSGVQIRLFLNKILFCELEKIFLEPVQTQKLLEIKFGVVKMVVCLFIIMEMVFLR